NFSPEIYGVKTEDMPYILGVQGNLWTERIQSENRLDYMLFPRIASLAETAWTLPDNKDFSSFKDRVTQHYPLYEQDNVYSYDFLDFRRGSEPMKEGSIPMYEIRTAPIRREVRDYLDQKIVLTH